MPDHDVYTPNQFRRGARTHAERLKETGRPAVLTVDGEPDLVIQSASAYQELLDRLDHAESVAGIRRGLESMRRGGGVPAEEGLEQLRSQRGVGAAVD